MANNINNRSEERLIEEVIYGGLRASSAARAAIQDFKEDQEILGEWILDQDNLYACLGNEDDLIEV